MTERIVVGVDGSDCSSRALTWATDHARRRNASLDIVWSWQPPAGAVTPMGMAYIPPSPQELQERAEGQLAALLATHQRANDLAAIQYQTIVADRSPGALLCDVARNADLLVIGSRGLGGFKGLILGSVGAHCAHASPSPVAIIPPGWNPAATTHGVTLVGVDGSANAAAAVRWADDWVPPGATVRIVCAWTYPVGYALGDLEIDDARLEAGCTETAETAAAQVIAHETETRCVHDDARVALPAQAREADLLVIGARGTSGMARLLVGSVASSIIHHLVVPTVLVRERPHD